MRRPRASNHSPADGAENLSDVDVTPSPLAVAVFLCAVFWPLFTGIAAAAALAYWKVWRNRWGLSLLIVTAIPAVVGIVFAAGTAYEDWSNERAAEADLRAHTHALASPYIFQGVRFPPGTTVTSAETMFEHPQVHVAGVALVGGAPVTGTVALEDGKLEDNVTYARPATVGGVPCAAGTVKFDAGKVVECDLSTIATIDGTPCAAGEFKRDVSTPIDCRLAAPVRYGPIVLPATTKYTFFSATIVMAVVGSKSPPLRILGQPLREGSILQFDGDLMSVDSAEQISYRECTTESFTYAIRARRTTPGSCSLPANAVTL